VSHKSEFAEILLREHPPRPNSMTAARLQIHLDDLVDILWIITLCEGLGCALKIAFPSSFSDEPI
jgi:hypothetical protein